MPEAVDQAEEGERQNERENEADDEQDADEDLFVLFAAVRAERAKHGRQRVPAFAAVGEPMRQQRQ